MIEFIFDNLESELGEYSTIPILLEEANKLPEFHDDKSLLLGKAVHLYRKLRKENDDGKLWEIYQNKYKNTLNDLHWWNQIFAQET